MSNNPHEWKKVPAHYVIHSETFGGYIKVELINSIIGNGLNGFVTVYDKIIPLSTALREGGYWNKDENIIPLSPFVLKHISAWAIEKGYPNE